MKKYLFIILALIAAAALAACSAGAENADLTGRYLPDGVEFLRSERDDGFTEYEYRDADNARYTLVADSRDNVRALEYDSRRRAAAEEAVLTQEEAFALIAADRPEARLISAVVDRDDGKYEWDLLFIDGSEVGFYELDAASGDILEYDIFYSLGEPVDPAAALTARIPEAQITEISISADDGRMEYEGEALTDRGVVEFAIDADTGTVIEFEYDD